MRVMAVMRCELILGGNYGRRMVLKEMSENFSEEDFLTFLRVSFTKYGTVHMVSVQKICEHTKSYRTEGGVNIPVRYSTPAPFVLLTLESETLSRAQMKFPDSWTSYSAPLKCLWDSFPHYRRIIRDYVLHLCEFMHSCEKSEIPLSPVSEGRFSMCLNIECPDLSLYESNKLPRMSYQDPKVFELEDFIGSLQY